MPDLKLPNGVDMPLDLITLPEQYRFYILSADDDGGEAGVFLLIDGEVANSDNKEHRQVALAMPLEDAAQLFEAGLLAVSAIQNGQDEV